MIEKLLELDAKIIFAHGMVSDKRDDKLLSMLEDIEARGSIPGVAAHNPVSTLKFIFENAPQVNTFLIPFNADGLFMGDQKKLEELIDSRKDIAIMGMKTVAAGKLSPKAHRHNARPRNATRSPRPRPVPGKAAWKRAAGQGLASARRTRKRL